MASLESLARQAWRAMPGRLTSSPTAQTAKRLVAARRRQHSPPPPVVVRTLDELDAMLAYLDEAAQVSDDELRRGFRMFRMELDRQMPPDPYSEAYRQTVMDLYEWLHGSPYEVRNERAVFELARFVDVPFPYSTRSSATVGNHLIAIGHVIRALDLSPESRVLEFGPGWGHTTIALAQMGHHVTAIDCSQDFIDLIQMRAERVNARIETMVGDFSLAHTVEGAFDAILFFESFHHCTDHQELLRALPRIMAAHGRVFFAAEPVERSFYVPWGLRLDGESLWAIRKNGWFELGFRESYFLQALARLGWTVNSANATDSPGKIWVARRQR